MAGVVAALAVSEAAASVSRCCFASSLSKPAGDASRRPKQSAHTGLPAVLDDAGALAQGDVRARPLLTRRLINRPSHDQVVNVSEMLRDAVGIPAVDAIGEGSNRQCRSRLKAVGQARTRHNCHCLSRPWRQEILRKDVNCLTVRLHRVRRSSSHVAHPRPFQRMGDHHA
jgi:hypothetical protein